MSDFYEPNSEMVRLDCNVDDMTGEDIGYAREMLMKEGAREVYIVPVQMKKDRPGIEFNVICAKEDANRLAQAVLRYTSTFGVRRSDILGYALDRSVETLSTEFGQVRVKTGEGYGVKKQKLEYEDVKAYAGKAGMSIAEARANLMKMLSENK